MEAVLSKLSLDHDADSPLLIEVQQRGEDGKIIEQDALKKQFWLLKLTIWMLTVEFTAFIRALYCAEMGHHARLTDHSQIREMMLETIFGSQICETKLEAMLVSWLFGEQDTQCVYRGVMWYSAALAVYNLPLPVGNAQYAMNVSVNDY